MLRWVRFSLVALRSLQRPKLGPLDASIVSGRVWPTDADLSVVNNAAYLVYFEMGRIDLQLRTGLAGLALRKRWAAPIASIHVQFRKPLQRFQRFTVSTRMVSWDDRWLYLEQRIDRRGETVATALLKALIIGKAGRVAPADAATELGFTLAASARPPGIDRYEQAETVLNELTEPDPPPNSPHDSR